LKLSQYLFSHGELGSLGADRFDPSPHSLRDELWAIVRAYKRRRLAQENKSVNTSMTSIEFN